MCFTPRRAIAANRATTLSVEFSHTNLGWSAMLTARAPLRSGNPAEPPLMLAFASFPSHSCAVVPWYNPMSYTSAPCSRINSKLLTVERNCVAHTESCIVGLNARAKSCVKVSIAACVGKGFAALLFFPTSQSMLRPWTLLTNEVPANTVFALLPNAVPPSFSAALTWPPIRPSTMSCTPSPAAAATSTACAHSDALPQPPAGDGSIPNVPSGSAA